MAGGSDGLDLYAGPGPDFIDDRDEHEIDRILCIHRQSSQHRFLVGSGCDDSKAQWISQSEPNNTLAVLAQ